MSVKSALNRPHVYSLPSSPQATSLSSSGVATSATDQCDEDDPCYPAVPKADPPNLGPPFWVTVVVAALPSNKPPPVHIGSTAAPTFQTSSNRLRAPIPNPVTQV